MRRVSSLMIANLAVIGNLDRFFLIGIEDENKVVLESAFISLSDQPFPTFLAESVKLRHT